MIRRSLHPTESLTPEDAVLAIIAASPSREIHGKKRVHKSAFLCKYCDAPISASFDIHNYGVFSIEIADALDFMTAFGDLHCREEQVGRNKYFGTVYSLPSRAKPKRDAAISAIVAELSKYSVPTLEVASTIAYFLQAGTDLDGAIERTEWIKPDLSTPSQIRASKHLLNELRNLRDSGYGQRSANP